MNNVIFDVIFFSSAIIFLLCLFVFIIVKHEQLTREWKKLGVADNGWYVGGYLVFIPLFSIFIFIIARILYQHILLI